MDNTGMRVADFSRYLSYPCHLEHDSKSAACLELWNHQDLDSAVILLLNRNMGGAIITNHQIHQGRSMHSGIIEHMCINPDGPLCYCGNRGCLETYCSANSLEHSAGLHIKEFFPSLRRGESPQLTQIWEDYLSHRLSAKVYQLNRTFPIGKRLYTCRCTRAIYSCYRCRSVLYRAVSAICIANLCQIYRSKMKAGV